MLVGERNTEDWLKTTAMQKTVFNPELPFTRTLQL
jgi:hypothetical protein